ncbi:MAG: hypothetical protein H2174_01865 [Vampirovibrio sp.]|nr:hypothetical protein [Vampirovibrio sp.]
MMGSNVNGSNGAILTGTLIGAGFGLKGMSDQQANKVISSTTIGLTASKTPLVNQPVKQGCFDIVKTLN